MSFGNAVHLDADFPAAFALGRRPHLWYAPWVAFALAVSLSAEGRGHDLPPPEPDTPPATTTRNHSEPPPGDESFVVVEGQVTDHIGAGQAGVNVTVRRKTDGAGGEVIATTTTDEIGDFVVTTPQPVSGDFVVLFSKPHYADLVREIHIDEGTVAPFLAETLQGKLVIAGRIVEALKNETITGASILLRAGYQEWRTRSDGQGRFEIKNVLPGKGEMIVEANGYGRERLHIPRLHEAGELVMSLKPERVVHLRVVDELGKPITGVTVEGYDEPREDFRMAVTDENGLVTFGGLHFDASRLSLRLTHKDFVSDQEFDREIVTPKDQAESAHKLVMARAGRISGTITEADTGKPLNGARVMTGEEYTDTSPRDWTDDKGRYVIEGVKPGPATVTIHLSAYAPELKTVEVKAGDTAKLDFALRRTAMLVGVVRNEAGEPIMDAYVETTRWRNASTLGLRAMTNSMGFFVIAGAPHDEFEIAVAARGYGKVKKVVKAEANKWVKIILPPAPPGATAEHIPGVKVGDRAPAFTLTTLDGRRISLADLKGRTVLLNFWATWCVPCVAELPYLIAVYEKFGTRKDFVMIGLSRDFDEKTLRDFLRSNGKLKWHQVFGEEGGVEAACEAYGVSWIPRVILISPDGKIAANELDGEEIGKRVAEMLKAKDPK